MPTSLVTGAAGFIGSHVAERLVKRGHKVVVLDDLSGGFRDNVPPGATFAQGSILDVDLIDQLFKTYRFDYIYHLAAYAAEGLSHFIKVFNYQNNLIGSVNLINASVNYGVKCFVFTSSMAVYGAGQTPFMEDAMALPEDSYGIAKLAVESELEVSHRMFGLDYVIFRPHNVYGERQNIGDKYRNVVGIFMNQLLKGQPMTIFGSGEQQRAFSHISDAAPIIAECVDNKRAWNRVYNIGADTPYTVNQLAVEVAKAMGMFANVKYLPPRAEVAVAFSDHTRVREAFGAPHPHPLHLGLKQMADWVKKHGARESQEFKHIEITKNLPPSWAKSAR